MKNTSRTELSKTPTETVKTKKEFRSPREDYLLEKDRIIHEIGSLEEIRLRLGLSQRKICQLLLVDPSAWTRWNKSEAPPHIYQSLRWLLELRKTNPQAAGPTNLDARVDFIQSNTQTKLKELETHIAALERALTLTSQTPSYVAAPDEQALERVLNAQEQRFQQEISHLKGTLEQLLAKKPSAGRKKPISKISRKASKKKKRVIKKKGLKRKLVKNKKSKGRSLRFRR